MSDLQEAADLIRGAIFFAQSYAGTSGGAYRTVYLEGDRKGEIAVDADIFTPVGNVKGLPGEWGTVYEGTVRELRRAFDLIRNSTNEDAKQVRKALFRVLDHMPSVLDLEARRIDKATHRDLPIGATPADRMLWLVDIQKPILLDLFADLRLSMIDSENPVSKKDLITMVCNVTGKDHSFSGKRVERGKTSGKLIEVSEDLFTGESVRVFLENQKPPRKYKSRDPFNID